MSKAEPKNLKNNKKTKNLECKSNIHDSQRLIIYSQNQLKHVKKLKLQCISDYCLKLKAKQCSEKKNAKTKKRFKEFQSIVRWG